MSRAANQSGGRYFLTLSLGALGVVYGDIGTSPLYAFRECFNPEHHVRHDAATIIGIVSLIFWSLTIIISIKYLLLVMRADNRGEGGILALMSLVRVRSTGQHRWFIIGLGLFGAALLYGDGMITPAISVLSAIEGLEIATPVFKPYVVPITLVVLVSLFIVQRFGTAKVGAVFGPVMLVWFAVLAAIGIKEIALQPRILTAINPMWSVHFFLDNRMAGFLVLGAVFLAVTGGEALYADMGHFGAKPIRVAWFAAVFPSLLLNYFGQGALMLRNPHGYENPFYLAAPPWALYPLVILSAVATVIASQAVISGAFSLTLQAVQLGYLPRLRIHHTSQHEMGQIYIPAVNWVLMASAVGLVIAFERSSALAAAYGLAVTATMAITTLILSFVERERWHWSLIAVALVTTPLLIIDLAFFGANLIKVAEGGWFPLLVGLLVFTLMSTWQRGRQILAERLHETQMPFADLLDILPKVQRVPGTAVYLTRQADNLPVALVNNLRHNKIAHERMVVLSVQFEETAHTPEEERAEWKDLGHGLYRLTIHFGYMDVTDIPHMLTLLRDLPFRIDDSTSFFISRETLLATARPGMALWRERLFSAMNRNAGSAADYFCLPPRQVIEIGAQVEL